MAPYHNQDNDHNLVHSHNPNIFYHDMDQTRYNGMLILIVLQTTNLSSYLEHDKHLEDIPHQSYNEV